MTNFTEGTPIRQVLTIPQEQTDRVTLKKVSSNTNGRRCSSLYAHARCNLTFCISLHPCDPNQRSGCAKDGVYWGAPFLHSWLRRQTQRGWSRSLSLISFNSDMHARLLISTRLHSIVCLRRQTQTETTKHTLLPSQALSITDVLKGFTSAGSDRLWCPPGEHKTSKPNDNTTTTKGVVVFLVRCCCG